MSDKNPIDGLDSMVSPETAISELPDPQIMIDKALEILSQSSVSFELSELVSKQGLRINVINTPQEVTYAPESKDVYIGVTSFNPTYPAKFILLVADALLEAQLEIEGFKQPELTEAKEKYITATATRKAKKVARLCAIAFDLDQKEQFEGYHFVDEMHKLGHNEAMDVFVNNI